MFKCELPRTKLFISYSHNDRKYLYELQEYLRPYEMSGLIETYDDTRIKKGENWREELDRALKSTKVAILSISQSFMASEFIRDYELPALSAAKKSKGFLIIPVIPVGNRYQIFRTYRLLEKTNSCDES